MSIKIEALTKCQSIEQVVELINDEFATDAESELIAAKYAVDAAVEMGEGVGKEDIVPHLEALSSAKFDFFDALELAIKEVSTYD